MHTEVLVLTGSQSKKALREAADTILREIGPKLRTDERDRPEKNWLTNKESCAYLGISKATMKRHRASGLPFSRVGQNVYHHINDLEALLESGRVQKDRAPITTNATT